MGPRSEIKQVEMGFSHYAVPWNQLPVEISPVTSFKNDCLYLQLPTFIFETYAQKSYTFI